jgi:formylglycine-generating enzyme required for sulfatase activity
VDAADVVVAKQTGRRYYRRLARDVAGQRVVLVVVPQNASEDPRTFYAMENKVWNDLYAAFLADPESKRLLKKYSSRPGCESLVSATPLWKRGAYAPDVNPDPNKEPFFGVEGPQKGRLPVFRVTVTEAHCFAEWLGGRLPSRKQWRKAAGLGEDDRPGPFSGDPDQTEGLAVNLSKGPWPVDQGGRDVSIYGCRQMASNGYEWTRDLPESNPGTSGEIPLEKMNLAPLVVRQGQSYLAGEPLTFQAMAEPGVAKCTEAPFDVSFRVVLEQ